MSNNNTIAVALKKQTALREAEISLAEVQGLLEAPRDKAHGDIAFPCFSLAKQLRKSPAAIAEELLKQLEPIVSESAEIQSVTAAGPYLNFTLNKGFLAQQLIPAIMSGDILKPTPVEPQKIMVEYAQLNSHKAMHVGHARNASLGDTIRRLLEWQGHTVTAVNYPGDEGTHVAKCLWFLTQKYTGEIPTENRGEFLGKIYSDAVAEMSLSNYSKTPISGVYVAQVTHRAAHPENAEWLVLKLQTHLGEKQVVTAGLVNEGDFVAYAPPGGKIAGKRLTAKKLKGTLSEGMICDESECGIDTGSKNMAVLAGEASIGTPLADLFPTELCQREHPGKSPTQVVVELEAQVSKVLAALEEGEEEMKALWSKTRRWSLDEMEEFFNWLGCHFDRYFFESEMTPVAKSFIEKHQADGLFVKDQGATGVDLSDEKLGFCILLKSDGTTNYASKDLALAFKKFEDYGLDRSIYVVDDAQTFHFQQVFAVLRRMQFEKVDQCYHLAYAMVTTPDGKMSSRLGNIILFSDLQQRLRSKILGEYLEKYRGIWSDEEIESTLSKVAVATIRYGMLTQDSNSVIIFDLDEWVGRSGNTGPYMLYSYARIQSILREAGDLVAQPNDLALLVHPDEASLVTHLAKCREVFSSAAEQLAPHLVCTYLFEMSKLFNRFYSSCPILKAPTENLKQARLALIEANAKVLAQGLELLGIQTANRL